MAPEGTWYNNRLFEGSIPVVWAVVVVVAVMCDMVCQAKIPYSYVDKNDNFACHVTFAG
jgi:hypothetical protein